MGAGGILNFGLSQYETKAYLSLLSNHPVNGSQLSRHSGIPRARIYDVLSSLKAKGMVIDLDNGHYVPLPPEEMLDRIRNWFENEVSDLETRFKAAATGSSYDYVWTIRGYDEVMAKAQGMIGASESEVYVRLFPVESKPLDRALHEAVGRGVQVKVISMGSPVSDFDLQVVHPRADQVEARARGRAFDLVVDKQEALVGLFEQGRENKSPINWAKNHWFVVATRDSLRHDFYHYFLHKIYDLKEPLSGREAAIYELIKADE
jgi:sugar-specific transcriptional regulator TrmB